MVCLVVPTEDRKILQDEEPAVFVIGRIGKPLWAQQTYRTFGDMQGVVAVHFRRFALVILDDPSDGSDSVYLQS